MALLDREYLRLLEDVPQVEEKKEKSYTKRRNAKIGIVTNITTLG